MTYAPAHPPHGTPTPHISPGPAGEAARVCSADGASLTVSAGGAVRAARLALSCLVQPEPGDQVLLAEAGGDTWVLAVLHREGAGPVRLQARNDLEIVSPGTLTIRAGSVALHARLARLLVDEVAHAGRAVTAHVARVRLVGEAVETLVERVMLRAKRSYRFIEETDQLRSRDINHRAEDTLHLHGGHAFVTATGVVKVDGSQIHMG